MSKQSKDDDAPISLQQRRQSVDRLVKRKVLYGGMLCDAHHASWVFDAVSHDPLVALTTTLLCRVGTVLPLFRPLPGPRILLC